ncbi:MAG: FtsX-like permease family protein [Desulfomonilaceae bacterium]|nr:FtsX-like permease family protein [Desulfomonilaceae bacterium]
MDLLKLIVRNVFRHRLRSGLTILGVVIAMLAFGILRTLVGAWYAGVEASSANRLVVRNKISLIYSLPLAYKNRILHVRDVTGVAYGVWYGGVYKDKKNFFAQFAVSGLDYLDLYPDLILTVQERGAFRKNRKAAIAGRKLAQRYGWKVGDVIPLQGTIYPGDIALELTGIYKGARKTVDETAFFFHYDYLNEHIKKVFPERADKTGWYMVRISDAARAPEISEEIDALFKNSLAETLTETEKAFQLGFVAMTGAIVGAIKVISVVVIAVILIVLANTMAMTARERSAEYAVLKTLGFGPRFLFLLIAGESVAIASIGGVLGAVLSYPGARIFQVQLENFLPVFEVSATTVLTIPAVALLVGLVAALPPAIRVSRIGIAEGLRHIG